MDGEPFLGSVCFGGFDASCFRLLLRGEAAKSLLIFFSLLRPSWVQITRSILRAGLPRSSRRQGLGADEATETA